MDQGNIIHAQHLRAGLVVITQVQPIAVLFTLPEDSLQDVIQHMKNEQLGVQAYSRDDQTKLATGKLLTIDNQIDPTTGTVRFKAEFANEDLSLWPNQFVNIRLMLDVRKNAIVIPLAAVQHGTQGSYVYTVKNGHANLQPVKVDLTQGNISLIASGVAAGDQVVVDGQDRLQSGSAVEVHGASPNGPGNGPAGGSTQADSAGGPKRGQRSGGDAGSQGDPGKDSGKRDPSKHKQPGKARANESIQAIYSSSGRHFSADGRDSAGRGRGLQAASGFRSASGGLSHDPGSHFLSGGESRGDGLVGDHAAGAAIWPGAGAQPDDVDEFLWGFADHAAIRAGSEYRRRRAASSGCD